MGSLKLCASFVLMAGVGSAQGADRLPRFEAASVKPAKPGQPTSLQVTPGRIVCAAMPMKALIQYAFRAPQYQLSGRPKWWESDVLDFAATMPAGTTQPALRLMMQDLLRTRFHLAAHGEKKELPIFALRQSPSGLKFQVEKREEKEGDGRISGGPGRVAGLKITVFLLAEVLSDYLDRPVVDETGIDGLFDFKLVWTPDEMPRQLINPTEQHAPADLNGASIFSAIQEQLGLHLVPEKGSIDMLVIDQVDRGPTEN